MPEKLFDEFTRELEYLQGTSPAIIGLYDRVFKRYQKFCGNEIPIKFLLNQVVVGMREHDLANTTCNMTIRGFNSFFFLAC